MSYFSDVTFAFYAHPDKPEMLPAIKLWVEENWPRVPNPIIESRDDIIVVKYYEVLWYEDTDFVVAVWDAVRLFEEVFDTEIFETHRAHWEFARVGQDVGDIETGGSSYIHYRVDIQRTITIT